MLLWTSLLYIKHRWYKRFQDGWEHIEDDKRSGRLSTSTINNNVERMKNMIMAVRQITIRAGLIKMLAYKLDQAMKLFRMFYS